MRLPEHEISFESQIVNSRPGSLEYEAIKKVIRENWKRQMTASHEKSDKEEKDSKERMLEEHAKAMHGTLGLGYEGLCMQNITINSKGMTAVELGQYLKSIEALAIAYGYVLGNNEMLNVILVGLTQVAKNTKAMKRYLNSCMLMMDKKELMLVNKSSRVRAGQEQLLNRLNAYQSGWFSRLFKKGRIQIIKRKAAKRGERLSRLASRLKEHKEIKRMALSAAAAAGSDS